MSADTNINHKCWRYSLVIVTCFALVGTAISGEIKSRETSYKAIVPNNNDLDPDSTPKGNTIRIPNRVSSKINTLIKKNYYEWRNACVLDEGEESEECNYPIKSFYGNVIKLSTPIGLDLYVYEYRYMFGNNFYGFILYDPKTDHITSNPPEIYGKWMDGDWGGRLQKPIVSFSNNIGDNSYKLVVQERVHNGTMYNAVMYRYYAIDDNLSLVLILNIETRLLDLYTEETGGVIERNIKRTSPDELLLTAILKQKGKHDEVVGEAILRQSGKYLPYKIVNKSVRNNKYDKLVVTAFGSKEENNILQYGYNFYY